MKRKQEQHISFTLALSKGTRIHLYIGKKVLIPFFKAIYRNLYSVNMAQLSFHSVHVGNLLQIIHFIEIFSQFFFHIIPCVLTLFLDAALKMSRCQNFSVHLL